MKRVTTIAMLIGSFLGQAAHAQVLNSSHRYAWDNRPPKCFAPDVPPVAMCQEPQNWVDFPTTVWRAQTLLVNQDTTLLDRAGADLAWGANQFASGQYWFEAWYLADTSQLATASDDVLLFTEAWRQSAGAGSPALLVNAMALHGQAWRARGHGYASSVSPEAWAIFHEKLAKADALLDTASSELKQSGPWHLLKVQLAFDQTIPDAKRAAILKAAIEAWPDSTMLHEIPMARSAPVWGGSFEKMDEVARTAAQASKFRSPAAMYALVYERAFRGNLASSLRSSKIDWRFAKQGFHDIEVSGRFPPWIWQNFANLACQMRDREEAKRLYKLNDQQGDGAESQQSTDACRAFANGS